MSQRRGLSKSTFAIPSKAPGSGSYPIPDAGHAKAALSFVSRYGSSSEKATVRRKVHSKFPGMGRQALVGQMRGK